MNNVFSFAESKQFLHIESVSGYNLHASFDGAEVVTFSFDFIGRVNDFNEGEGNRWVNFRLQSGSGLPVGDGSDIHNTSFRPSSNIIRGGGNPLYGLNGI